MLYDRIYAKPCHVYVTINKKIKIIFLFNNSEDMIKFISEYYIILFIWINSITDKYSTKLTLILQDLSIPGMQ